MAIKTLLVCLTSRENALTLMPLASELAREHNAHLVGLHTVEALLVYPGIAMHVPEPAFAAFNASQKEEAKAIEAIFHDSTRNEIFPAEWRMIQAESSSATNRIVESARAASLVIMARAEKENGHYDQTNLQEQVIRYSGRPVLIVPPGYKGSLPGRNILLGWSDTREATRAAHDLVSVALKNAEVRILHVTNRPKEALTDVTTVELAASYDRHGLRTTIQHVEAKGGDIAASLMQTAFETGADLIVTGAFGHSKAYDFVVGAVSHSLLKSAAVPVMFST